MIIKEGELTQKCNKLIPIFPMVLKKSIDPKNRYDLIGSHSFDLELI